MWTDYTDQVAVFPSQFGKVGGLVTEGFGHVGTTEARERRHLFYSAIAVSTVMVEGLSLVSYNVSSEGAGLGTSNLTDNSTETVLMG